MVEVLKEGANVCPPTSVVRKAPEVTEEGVVVTENVMPIVVPRVVSAIVGAGMVLEVVRSVLMALDWEEIVASSEWDVV